MQKQKGLVSLQQGNESAQIYGISLSGISFAGYLTFL